jgi:hypothetical protein
MFSDKNRNGTISVTCRSESIWSRPKTERGKWTSGKEQTPPNTTAESSNDTTQIAPGKVVYFSICMVQTTDHARPFEFFVLFRL